MRPGGTWKQNPPTLTQTQHTMKGHKMSNPYQLRYELLMAAENRLVEKYRAAMDQWHARNKGDNNLIAGELPIFPTHEEIFDLANAMRAFVDTK